MLYHLYDMHRAAMMPAQLWAEAVQSLYRNPLVPASHTVFGRTMAATAEMFERTCRRVGRPAFGLPTTLIGGVPVAVTEAAEVINPFCTLRHFQRAVVRQDPKVLLIAPMAGHHATLLRGTVEAMLPDHDIYITDWSDACQVPLSCGPFDLDDFIATLLDCFRRLGPDLHVIAVCQPAAAALAATALLAQDDDPAQPHSLTLIGGPIDVAIAPTLPSSLAQQHSIAWFESTVISQVPLWYPGAMRRVFPGFIQLSGFMSMNMDRHISAHWRMFNHLVEGDGDSASAHKKFYNEYQSVMDMPAEFYLQTVASVFQRQDIANGTMSWRGHPVQPAAIRRTGIMTIEGERDDISAPGQTVAAHRLTPNVPANRRDHHLQANVGHFGLFNGRRWRNEILPRLAAFIRAQA